MMHGPINIDKNAMCAFLKNINISTLVSLTKENDKKHNCD